MSKAAQSTTSKQLRPRLEQADRIGTSICPFCAVGCAPAGLCQERQADPYRGRSAQPGEPGHALPERRQHARHAAAARRASTRCSTARPTRPSGRRSRSTGRWSAIAQLTKQVRDETFVERLPDGKLVNHTLGLGSLGRRHARQRRELPDQEAVRRRPRDGQHREPSPHLTLLFGAQFGHLLRTRRGDHGPLGPGEFRLRGRHGLQHGGEPSDRLPLRGGGASGAARRVIHVDPRFTRTARAVPTSMRRSARAPTSRSWAASSATSSRAISGSATSRWPTPTSPTSSRTATATPSSDGRRVLRLRRQAARLQRGELAVQGQGGALLDRRAPGPGRAERAAIREHGARARRRPTRRCSTRTASTRS